jgi:hypothetical protein
LTLFWTHQHQINLEIEEMGKKKKKSEQKPNCWYCDRDFDDEKILIQHQKAKHFKCHVCHKKLTSATGMAVHVYKVHKETITKVPNAKTGRDALNFDVLSLDDPEHVEPVVKKPRVEAATAPVGDSSFSSPPLVSPIPTTNLPPPIVSPPLRPPVGMPLGMAPPPFMPPGPMGGIPPPFMPPMPHPSMGIPMPPMAPPFVSPTPPPFMPPMPHPSMGIPMPPMAPPSQQPSLVVHPGPFSNPPVSQGTEHLQSPPITNQGKLQEQQGMVFVFYDEDSSMEEKRAELLKYKIQEKA